MYGSRANNTEQLCLENKFTSSALYAQPCSPKVFTIANPFYTILDAHWYMEMWKFYNQIQF